MALFLKKSNNKFYDDINSLQQKKLDAKLEVLNNVNDYKQFGGPLKTDVVARTEFEEGLGSLKSEVEGLQSSTNELLTTAKSMKDDAEKGLKSAEDDLKTFFETFF